MNTSNYSDIYKNIPLEHIKISEIYDEFKTGDLIFFRSAIASIFVDKLIPTTIYKHVGMIIKINKELYLTEATVQDFLSRNENTGEIYTLRSGINITPLKTRIKYYAGMVFYHKLNQPLERYKKIKLMSYIGDLLDIPYPSAMSLYMNLTFGIKIANDLYCYEYIYLLLKHIDIITEHKKSIRDISEYIANIYKHQLNGDFRYEPGKLVIYDYRG